jgi:hypothetical protein
MSDDEAPPPNHYFDCRREDDDLFPLPARTNNERWKFESEHMLIIKDSALAALNGMKACWPLPSIIETTCHTHAGLIWCSHHAKHFQNYAAHKSIFNTNLTHFKNCPHVNLVPIARTKLLEKLRKLGEDTVADLWEQSWAQKWITRVEANFPQVLSGYPI